MIAIPGMVNASALPALFAGSTWVSGGLFNNGSDKLLASHEGAWIETPPTDDRGFRITEPLFDAIKAAAAANPDGSLQVEDPSDPGQIVAKAVAGTMVAGVRWIRLADVDE